MTHSTDDLHMIGAALAAAGDGESVELTDEQREVLARATVPDTLDAILAHATILPPEDIIDAEFEAHNIATMWYDELRAAFRLQSIADAINENDNPETIRDIVSQDDRLSAAESQILLNALAESQILLNALPTADSHNSRSSSPRRAYLASISVEGFRGIGRPAHLPLEPPQPGLTLIYGTNGSGKSTFVEALDVLLTSNTARFAGRGPEWGSAWANAHRPDRGQIAAEFVVGDQDRRRDTIHRGWTAADLSAATVERGGSLWGPIQTIGSLDISETIDKFRPILGYGELGPLFEESDLADHSENSGNATEFAQHIQARANVRDGTTNALLEFFGNNDDHDALHRTLSAWFRIAAGGLADNNADRMRLSSINGDRIATLRSPARWNWTEIIWRVRPGSPEATEYVNSVLDVSRPYLPQLADRTREHIVEMFRRSLKDRPRWGLEDHSRWVNRWVNHFLAYAPRVTPYAEMLLDEIHSARLARFSQCASDFWQKIRPGNDVQFEALSLEQHRVGYGRPTPQLRVSLGLTIDGGRAIERGALSQGELHSLALSIFLPTLMNPESPFGFAVIDDPVQAMDEHAVYGLAEVLLDAAKDLQVIVFTHDKRLIGAVQLLDSDRENHKLINVTRSAGSVVRCEVADHPAEHALKLARIAAARPVDDDSWTNVAFHCRRAVEHACIAAGQRRLRAANMSPADIEDFLDEQKQHERHSTQRLMAIAIWGQASRWEEVRREEIDRLNVLVHDEDEQEVEKARGKYKNLETLISETAQLVATIGESRV